jgi:hypothetical protein
MFKLSLDKKEYKVRFYYQMIQNGQEFLNGIVCTITCDDKIIAKGISSCSRNDIFVNSVGRKIALGRALQLMYPGNEKSKRTIIWDEYFRLSPKSKLG